MLARFSSVCLEAWGSWLPSRVVTSATLEAQLAPVYERLKLPAGRLELMTGVRERRLGTPGLKPSDLAVNAAEQALAQLDDTQRSAMGALVYGGVCRDFLEPATASVVHDRLKLPASCLAFDLSNACLGVLNAMVVVATMIEAGQIRAGLVVSGEDGRELVESTVAALLADATLTRQSIKPHFASLTIGAAGVAVVLTHASLASHPARRRLRSAIVHADTAHHRLCQGDHTAGGGTLMRTDSEALLLAGVELAGRTWEAWCDALPMPRDGSAVDRVFGHKVGRQHRRALFARLGLDPAKEFSTFETLGNVGSAAAPITMMEAAAAGFLRNGHSVALMGIGSGLHCQMLNVAW